MADVPPMRAIGQAASIMNNTLSGNTRLLDPTLLQHLKDIPFRDHLAPTGTSSQQTQISMVTGRPVVFMPTILPEASIGASSAKTTNGRNSSHRRKGRSNSTGSSSGHVGK